jgi:oligoribonuclease (3'-5' exoribonuclease)
MLEKLFNSFDCVISLDTETTGLNFENDKIIELKNIFSDETISLEELRNMEISYKKNHVVYDDPSSLTANAQPLFLKIETNEKQEVKFDAIDPKIEKNKKLKDNKNE